MGDRDRRHEVRRRLVLRLNSAEEPRVSYYDRAAGNLRFQAPSLVLDGDGNAFVVYQEIDEIRSDGNLRYAQIPAAPTPPPVSVADGTTLGGVQLHAPWPSPARGTTRIGFNLPRSGVASVDVYDVSGRRVRRLGKGTCAAGSHSLGWDGRDQRGARVAAGVYLVRLSAEGVTRARRIVALF